MGGKFKIELCFQEKFDRDSQLYEEKFRHLESELEDLKAQLSSKEAELAAAFRRYKKITNDIPELP